MRFTIAGAIASSYLLIFIATIMLSALLYPRKDQVALVLAWASLVGRLSIRWFEQEYDLIPHAISNLAMSRPVILVQLWAIMFFTLIALVRAAQRRRRRKREHPNVATDSADRRYPGNYLRRRWRGI